MQSIRYKILGNFCLAALISITSLSVVVLIEFDNSITEQSETLARTMTRQSYSTLNLPHNTFGILIQEDTRRSIQELRKSPSLLRALDAGRLKAVEAELHTFASNRELDFALFVNRKGHIEVSFPKGIHELELEDYLRSWDFGAYVFRAFEDEAFAKHGEWQSFARQSPQVLKFLELEARAIPEKGALSAVAAGLVQNDFDEILGMCVIGKLLNGYQKPLQHLTDIAGYANVLYLDTIPIAQAGFKESEQEDFELNSLAIPDDVRAAIFQSEKNYDRILTLAGTQYLSSCAPLKSFSHENIGALCVGLPEAHVTELQQEILQRGDLAINNLKWWVAGIGLASITFFVIASLIIAQAIVGPLLKSVRFAQAVAQGELSTTLHVTQNDEIGILASALKDMVFQLNMLITAIKDAAENVGTGSRDMNGNSLKMAEGAARQAASAEEVSTSIEQMVANISQNADNAIMTEKLALRAIRDARESGKAVQQTVDAMRQIAEKTSIIEEIATQTRLLSLNATIEASRASEHGKGFSVVASEVRSLAERSKEAAEEIRELAASSVNIAEDSGTKLLALIPAIQKTTELIQEISAAGGEQKAGAEQINQAIQHLNLEVQSNVAQSEHVRTTAVELYEQAKSLHEAVKSFKTS